MFAQADSPYSKQVDEIISELKTHPEEGLSEQEVLVRLKEFGRNRLKEKKKISPLYIYLNQYKDFMMLILMVVAAVSFLIHDKEDGVVILAVVFFNTFIGFLQEYKAEKTLSALKKSCRSGG